MQRLPKLFMYHAMKQKWQSRGFPGLAFVLYFYKVVMRFSIQKYYKKALIATVVTPGF